MSIAAEWSGRVTWVGYDAGVLQPRVSTWDRLNGNGHAMLWQRVAINATVRSMGMMGNRSLSTFPTRSPKYSVGPTKEVVGYGAGLLRPFMRPDTITLVDFEALGSRLSVALPRRLTHRPSTINHRPWTGRLRRLVGARVLRTKYGSTPSRYPVGHDKRRRRK